MPIETQNLRIVISRKRNEAVVLLKRELYLSDIVDDVMTELANIDFTGQVIFDMLLIKGVSEQYYNMQFRNRTLDYSTNHLLNNPGNVIVSVSKRYYRAHPDFVVKTSLTKRQKDCVREWIEMR